MLRLLALAVIFTLLACDPAKSAVIFEDNFNDRPDWSVPQAPMGSVTTTCVQGLPCDVGGYLPSGYYDFRLAAAESCSNLDGLHDTMHIDNKFYRGAGGKSFRMWTEACPSSGGSWGSDGLLGVAFTPQNEIYIRYFIKFPVRYKWDGYDNTFVGPLSPMMKLLHVSHLTDPSSDIWNFSGGVQNKPRFTPQLAKYTNGTAAVNSSAGVSPLNPAPDRSASLSSYAANYYFPGATADFTTTVGDGNWHSMQWHLKLNTPGNADGVHEEWYDGVKIGSNTAVRWIPAGDDPTLWRWDHVWLGGNNYNYILPAIEQEYAVDDFVISTTYIPDDYDIGTPPIDNIAPVTTAAPIAGTYATTQSITLSTDEPATIYYTLDGSTPTTSSAVYSVPLVISSTTTLKYFSRDAANNSEAVKTATYTINLPQVIPVASARFNATLR